MKVATPAFNVLFDFEHTTHEEWQQLRQTNYNLDFITIGGSDAGVLMGVNKYKDVAQLYLEKKGIVNIPVDNEMVEWGNTLEPVIADKFAEKNPHLEVMTLPQLLQSKDHPFMVANVDRILYDHETGEHGILEIKTASEYVKGDWSDGAIPPSYYAQIQHYMVVTGLSWGYFAVLIGGNKYHQVEVQRNDDYINSMIFQQEVFVMRTELNQMPELTGSDSSKVVVNHLYPQGTCDEVVAIAHGDLIIERENLREQVAHLQEELAACENKIKAELGDNLKGSYHDGLFEYVVSWNNVKGRATFDSKSLKTDLPEVYEKYAKTGNPTRKFQITRKAVG